jgi:DNA-binding helix-hairpin-helix protein with protein kinase domain
MPLEAVFAANRARLKLGSRLGKGGEGAVYALADRPSEAVKVYHADNLTEDLRAKVQAMINAGLAKATSLVAYPVELVTDEKGRFLGFTMSKVGEHKPLHQLYSPGARKVEFPRADFRFLVHTAANVARAVAAVHQSGCVIGDINESGILVSDRATVALIDADSFQVTADAARYLCGVGKPEYTPPELQGKPLDKVVRTPDHDAFGLAVVVFQLLWMGRHPFSGRFDKGDMPIERAIAENRFAYSRARSVGMTPPPNVPALTDFPQEIGVAFECAFSSAAARPTARDWVGLLDRLEKNLKLCGSVSSHYYPWQATKCPWCAMEAATGAELFPPALASSLGAGATATSLDIAALWRAIQAIAPPTELQLPQFPTVKAEPSAKALQARGANSRRKAFGFVLISVSVALLFGVPSLAMLSLGGAIWGAILLFGKSSGIAPVLGAAREKVSRFDAELSKWAAQCDSTPFQEVKDRLASAKLTLEGLAAEEARSIQNYTQNRRAEQLKTFLERHQIRKHRVKGIGPSKLATLTSYGIEDAHDVTHSRVMQVPGFGQVTAKALVDWRMTIEARFKYDPNPNQIDRARLASIKSERQRRESQFKQVLAEGPAALRAAVAGVQRKRSLPAASLQQLYRERCGAAADMELFGERVPPIVMPKAAQRPPQTTARVAPQSAPVSPQATRPAAPATSTNCPQCGSRMVLRTARRGGGRGRQFWGCSRYPACRGTRPY